MRGLREKEIRSLFEMPNSHLSREKQRSKPWVTLTFRGWGNEAEPARNDRRSGENKSGVPKAKDSVLRRE